MEQCPKQCMFTNQAHYLADADAVLFAARQMGNSWIAKPDLSLRKSHQRYVFMSIESPIREYFGFMKTFGMQYNWTITYRSDSDILMPYGRLVQNSDPGDYEMAQRLAAKKSRNLVWFISKCREAPGDFSGRWKYMVRLDKHIDVDVFGKCGQLCPMGNENCEKLFWYKYRFYVAFENSICEDYVTEKFYRSLQNYIVPVVLKRSIYRHIFNDTSKIFIAADDFQSPQHLADYLHYLSKNLTAYMEYFTWRKDYKIELSQTFGNDEDLCNGPALPRALCELCERLHENGNYPAKTYNMSEWWDPGTQCYRGYGRQLLG